MEGVTIEIVLIVVKMIESRCLFRIFLIFAIGG